MAVFVLDPPSAAVLKRQNGDESPVLKREYAAVPLPCSSVPGHSTTHLTTTMAATTTVYHAITVYPDYISNLLNYFNSVPFILLQNHFNSTPFILLLNYFNSVPFILTLTYSIINICPVPSANLHPIQHYIEASSGGRFLDWSYYVSSKRHRSITNINSFGLQ
ncbi:uncharacterized protein L3040_006277 [Drepanopeziza brunnea f. sp. 'multigermtubi']|uniref:uncharacterized protein n=1 Tax=Drepanopeziza brunnea f. sp. 'multigermtubi' TaxID=698441 RepID=UPI00238F6B72|nr:hypothetical protein L3040_006277 [Drepanopeziza brunnea f. sp. 'multigermtubi']